MDRGAAGKNLKLETAASASGVPLPNGQSSNDSPAAEPLTDPPPRLTGYLSGHI